MSLARHPIALTVALITSLNAAAQTADKPAVDPASWVPADVLAYVGVADIGKLGDEFRQTAFYRMTQDPGAKESAAQLSILLRVYDDFRKRLAKSLDIEPDKLRNPFDGPLALYVPVTQGALADKPGLVFVAGIGDAALVRRYYEQANRKFREITDQHEKVSFGSYTIDRFTTQAREEQAEQSGGAQDPNELDIDVSIADDEGLGTALDEVLGRLFTAEAMPEELALCLTEQRLIVGPTPEHVRDVLRRERAGDSLLQTEAYQTLLREFKPLGSVRLLVDTARLFDTMEAVEGDDAREALAMLGVKSVRSVIGHVLFDHSEFESKIELLMLMSGERTGLAKILSMENRAVTPPASVPAAALVYASMNANAVEILDEIERMIRREDPEAADEMRAGLESMELPDGGTLNLRKEVLENLREPLTFTMGFQRPYGPESTRICLAVGHRDKQAMARFLEKLSTIAPVPMIEREVRGTLAYDVAYGGFSLAPTDNALVVGTTSAVEAALQMPAPEDSLAAEPAFRRAAALAPREAWGVFYVDSRRMFETALEMAKHKDALTASQFTNPANIIALQIVEGFTMGVGEDQIDAARQLAKYQTPTILTVATTPAGIRLTQIELLSEKE